MAKATARVVEKVVKETQGVTLELSAEEAEWLKSFTYGYRDVEAISIHDALEAPAESDNRPIEVGDKVRIVKAAYDDSYNGRVGVVTLIDEGDDVGHYRVDLENYQYGYEWATTVERVND